MQFLIFDRMISVHSRTNLPPFGQSSKKSTNDPAQVIHIMKSTNFCEILSLLYGILIHETDNQINTENNGAFTVHEKILIIVINSMILLNTIATLDLDTFQVRELNLRILILTKSFQLKTTLGEESISLQLRCVANYILAYCNNHQTTMNDALLRQIIFLIGYYCLLNQDNQVSFILVI